MDYFVQERIPYQVFAEKKAELHDIVTPMSNFDYPSARKRTERNQEQIRAAEAMLDRFCLRVDLHCQKAAGEVDSPWYARRYSRGARIGENATLASIREGQTQACCAARTRPILSEGIREANIEDAQDRRQSRTTKSKDEDSGAWLLE